MQVVSSEDDLYTVGAQNTQPHQHLVLAKTVLDAIHKLPKEAAATEAAQNAKANALADLKACTIAVRKSKPLQEQKAILTKAAEKRRVALETAELEVQTAQARYTKLNVEYLELMSALHEVESALQAQAPTPTPDKAS